MIEKIKEVNGNKIKICLRLLQTKHLIIKTLIHHNCSLKI